MWAHNKKSSTIVTSFETYLGNIVVWKKDNNHRSSRERKRQRHLLAIRSVEWGKTTVLKANSKVSGYMNIWKKVLHCLPFTAKPFLANPISGGFSHTGQHTGTREQSLKYMVNQICMLKAVSFANFFTLPSHHKLKLDTKEERSRVLSGRSLRQHVATISSTFSPHTVHIDRGERETENRPWKLLFSPLWLNQLIE